MSRFLLFFITLIVISLGYSSNPSQPNVIFMLGDDWGWNDFSFAGATNIITPNLDYYKSNGLYLYKHYAYQICTPSRASLLSGKYASSIGMQHQTWNTGNTWAIPQQLLLLPQRLKQIGYRTHMIGKWHLGYPSWKDMPVQRGFDTFFGYLNGAEGYYEKNLTSHDINGLDFRHNNEIYTTEKYSTWLYIDRMKEVLKNNLETSDPFFIYAAFQAVHFPQDPPEKYWEYFENCDQSEDRCKTTAVAYGFDVAFGQLMSYLKRKNIWENTLVIFVTDNGGDLMSGKSNWPLRGSKYSYFEGGVRTQGFVTGGVLPENRKGQTEESLFHISDWYPTISSFVGDTEVFETVEFDGVDQKNTILQGTNSARQEILLNMDPYECDYKYCGAIIYKNWKIVQGNNVAYTTSRYGGWTALENQTSFDEPTVSCGGSTPEFVVDYNKCPWNGDACLYNLETDPCEYHDIKDKHPEIYQFMLKKLDDYNETAATPLCSIYTGNEIEKANPNNFDGWWTPWQDSLEDILEDTLEDTTEELKSNKKIKNNKWYKKWNFIAGVL